jgi:hypothetical protein
MLADPRLPEDLRIICVDPRWCLTEGDANDVAAVMDSFVAKVRESAVDLPIPEAASGSKRAKKKARNEPAPVVPLPPDEERAHVMADHPAFQSRNQHQRYATRARAIETRQKSAPTMLLTDLVRLMVKAGQNVVGGFRQLFI